VTRGFQFFHSTIIAGLSPLLFISIKQSSIAEDSALLDHTTSRECQRCNHQHSNIQTGGIHRCMTVPLLHNAWSFFKAFVLRLVAKLKNHRPGNSFRHAKADPQIPLKTAADSVLHCNAVTRATEPLCSFDKPIVRRDVPKTTRI
jgi:hypothetical protein